jgi:hypothetical protein
LDAAQEITVKKGRGIIGREQSEERIGSQSVVVCVVHMADTRSSRGESSYAPAALLFWG